MERNAALIREMRRLLAEQLTAGPAPGDDEGSTPLDLQWELDMLGEIARSVGTGVFWLDWDSGGPGAGAGSETVYELAGKYLYLSASFGWSGPYDTLDDAFGKIVVNKATRAISSTEWSTDEIIARMDFYDAPPVLEINGEDWPFETLEHRHSRLAATSEARDEEEP